jgi:hypothetical protein
VVLAFFRAGCDVRVAVRALVQVVVRALVRVVVRALVRVLARCLPSRCRFASGGVVDVAETARLELGPVAPDVCAGVVGEALVVHKEGLQTRDKGHLEKSG